MSKQKFDKKTIARAKFCKEQCPVCTKGREKGKGFLYQFVRFERHVCPMCRAYEKVYDVPAQKKIRP